MEGRGSGEEGEKEYKESEEILVRADMEKTCGKEKGQMVDRRIKLELREQD